MKRLFFSLLFFSLALGMGMNTFADKRIICTDAYGMNAKKVARKINVALDKYMSQITDVGEAALTTHVRNDQYLAVCVVVSAPRDVLEAIEQEVE